MTPIQPYPRWRSRLGAYDPGVIEAFAQAIKRHEGSSPAFDALNNPGNLMFAGQAGATPKAMYGRDGKLIGTFAQFSSYEAGWAALKRQIEINLSLYPGLTLREFFGGQRDAAGNLLPGGYPGYAPRGHGGNNPDIYTRNVSGWLGISPDQPLTGQLTTQGELTRSPFGVGLPLPSPSGNAAGGLPGALLDLFGGEGEAVAAGAEGGLDPLIVAGLAGLVLYALWPS